MNQLINLGNINTDTSGGNRTSVPSTTSDSTELIPYKLLSISEAARLLGIGKDNVYSLLGTGQLGFIEIGKRKKIPMMAINNYIIQNTNYQTESKKNKSLDDMQLESILYPSKNRKMKSIDGGKILKQIMRSG